MKKYQRVLTLQIILLLIGIHHDLFSQKTSSQIDTLVMDAMKKFNVAGVAIAIVKDGKVIHKKGYGVKDITTQSPVNELTNFEIASNSKAFTAAALSILVDEGKLSWKDKVIKFIPEFKMYNDYVTQNFIVEDLLCHRSGLGLGVGDLMMFPDSNDFTIQDVLHCFQYFEPSSAFRTQFNYDNQLYLVAGEIVKRISGLSWENFVQQRILQPLQMQHSWSSVSQLDDMNNVALPHNSESGIIKKIPLFGAPINGAAGGILSNVEDMSKWMMVQLNSGKYGTHSDKQLYSEERQQEMWTLHTVEPTEFNGRYHQHFNGYGLGWNLTDMKGNLSVSHTGGLPGMLSIVTMIPDIHLGIVILTNTENGGAGLFSSVSQTLLDSYLGLNDNGWVDKYAAYFQSIKEKGDEASKKVWDIVAKAKNTNITHNDIIGLYEDKWFGKVEIYVKENQLWFRSYRSPKLHGPMSFYKANTFAIKWQYRDMNCDAFATFTLDEEGKAQGIKMKGISPNIDFSFDFHDLDFHRVKE